MNPLAYLVVTLLVVVFFLIRAEFADQRRQIYFLKPLATLLVMSVATLALFQAEHNMNYTQFILGGLVFSLGGDIALMFPKNKKAFSVGLGLFLTAHIIYASIFFRLGHASSWSLFGLVILAIFGFGFYRIIHQKLGSMKLPVIAYIIIISGMAVGAAMLFENPSFGGGRAMIILVGAILFYISDIILAANRFWKEWKYNRISLAFYYSGQLLIALSTSWPG